MVTTKNILRALYLSLFSFLGEELDYESLETTSTIWNKLEKESFRIPKRILYGVPGKNEEKLRVVEVKMISNFLEIKHNIHDRESLIWEVDRLAKGSELTRRFQREVQRLRIMPDSHIKEVVESKYSSEKKDKYELILRNKDDLTKAGLYAYDIANAIRICRLGAFKGYLTNEEMLSKVLEIADKAYENYDSYEEFGIACRLGYKLEVNHLREFGNRRITIYPQGKVMNLVGYYVWPKLPWPEKKV